MRGFDLVERRQAVTPEGIPDEVRVGQPEVALIGDLVGKLQLHIEPVARGGWRETCFERVVGDFETALAATVDRLVSVRQPLVGFEQESEALIRRSAIARVQAPRSMLATLRDGRSGHLRRHRC